MAVAEERTFIARLEASKQRSTPQRLMGDQREGSFALSRVQSSLAMVTLQSLRIGVTSCNYFDLYFESGCLSVGSSRGRIKGACRVVAIAKFPKRIVPITCSQSG